MVIALFSMEDKEKKSHFFEETFLLANISMNIALEMFFFTLSNVKINFIDCQIYLRIYTIAEVFLITRHVKLIGKKKFVAIGFSLI